MTPRSAGPRPLTPTPMGLRVKFLKPWKLIETSSKWYLCCVLTMTITNYCRNMVRYPRVIRAPGPDPEHVGLRVKILHSLKFVIRKKWPLQYVEMMLTTSPCRNMVKYLGVIWARGLWVIGYSFKNLQNRWKLKSESIYGWF